MITKILLTIAVIAAIIIAVFSISFDYYAGYRDACKDFYKGHLKMDLVEREDGTKDWQWLEASHRKQRGRIPCDFRAWDDKNYFEGIKNKVIEQLDRWNAEDYYEVKRISCPRCGSYRIIGNIPRDRGVITGYTCRDCKYSWSRK